MRICSGCYVVQGGKGLTTKKHLEPIIVITLLILIPLIFVAPNVYSATEHPSGVVEQPDFLQGPSNKFILIILDGVGTDVMLDDEMMPELNSRLDEYAVLRVTTGPLTLSATCVKEMMTGVPNDPVDGLNNFDLNHPGGVDPWLLAAESPQHDVIMIGSYVMGNMYDAESSLDFIYTFKGHSDYYEGDDETYEIVVSVNENNSHNTIAAHFSGPDKVGHTWGIDSVEYAKKMIDIDKKIVQLVDILGDDWNVIITADHGMTESGTHGSAEQVTRDVRALIKGPDIKSQTSQDAHQRDISALTAALIHQPFPVQLNGQIPLDVLAYDDSQKAAIEQWNWQAAQQRYAFFNNGEVVTSDDEINWELVSDETKFDSNNDTLPALLTWVVGVLFCLYFFRSQMAAGRMFVLEAVTFATFVSILVYSQNRLDFSAMIPRGLGAACAVYLASTALSQYIRKSHKSRDSKPIISVLLSPIVIPYLIGLCFILTFDVSKSVVIGTMVWVVTYPLYKFQFSNDSTAKVQFSEGFYWIMAIACLTFSGIRLWFMLIPMFFFAVKSFQDYRRTTTSLRDNIQTIMLSLLLFISIIFVNNRITGFHVMNRLLRMGWPVDIISTIALSLLILGAIYLSNAIAKEANDLQSMTRYGGFTILCFLSLIFESSNYDRLIILALTIAYVYAIKTTFASEKSSQGQQILKFVVASHIMVIWGVWAAIVVLLMLPCVTIMLSKFSDQSINLDKSFTNPKVFVAMALTPWMIWILWWTLLGQVNGVQTCVEGICPHPRELDLGRVQVRGGYFGDRVNPNLYWMITMISMPIAIVSTWLMTVVRQSGMSLKPYMISQVLLALGSLNVLAFSAESPRLLFSVTWNIVFALLQIGFAILAELLHHYTTRYSNYNEKESSNAVIA